jgi:hypothetical protein
MLKVNRGGMKKKSQIKALSKAESNTGKISKNIAVSETVTSKTKATTLYPIIPEIKKHTPATRQTENDARKYCLDLLTLFLKMVATLYPPAKFKQK